MHLLILRSQFLYRIHIFQSEFCAKTVILESVRAYIISICYKEQSKIPEDDVDKGRSVSDLKSDQLTEIVH
jgi:hypothetical protein